MAGENARKAIFAFINLASRFNETIFMVSLPALHTLCYVISENICFKVIRCIKFHVVMKRKDPEKGDILFFKCSHGIKEIISPKRGDKYKCVASCSVFNYFLKERYKGRYGELCIYSGKSLIYTDLVGTSGAVCYF